MMRISATDRRIWPHAQRVPSHRFAIVAGTLSLARDIEMCPAVAAKWGYMLRVRSHTVKSAITRADMAGPVQPYPDLCERHTQ